MAADGRRTGRTWVCGNGSPWRATIPVVVLAVITVPLAGRPVALVAMLVVVAATLAMICAGVHRHRPPVPVAWLLLAASSVLFCVGTTLRDFLEWHIPPLDDLFTLGGYVGVGAAAVLWLVPRRTFHIDLILDSWLIGLGALLASWTFLISPVLHAARVFDGPTLIRVTYPVVDALLLTVVTHSMVTAGRSETSLRLVHLCLLTVLGSDLGYNLDAAGYVDLGPDVLLVPQLLAFLLVGLAALHPTMVTVGQPRNIHPHRSRQRASFIAVLLVVASLGPVVGSNLDTLDRAVVSALLAVLLVGVLARSERAVVRSLRSERRAQYQAEHDLLTGLANRAALLRAPVVYQDRWAGRPLCLLFLDLDGFKAINDTHGHAVGDELIAGAADRIRHVIGRDDLAARYGGDEFVVLGCANRQESAVLAERLLAAFQQPFELTAGPVSVAPSIGIACDAPRDADDTVYDLLREADSAMYHAKEYSLGYVFYDDIRNLGHAASSRRNWRRETAV
ncbi:GGDEF domain-containing protein [Nocardia sp. alder85J]|uniref:GGDEF domain-containing protein n=1 Tax=Nocardia sp. alder85J TaxID=2862949 RepID=UPI001CD36F79|nr:GGDEF domain-containing protein [Nocardia sp. alder85J]MCX4096957.1 GGDEF domain-containing protein [Nocardia sp. alder85J]